MACAGCIARQKKLVAYLCQKKPNGTLCLKAKARLERMQAPKSEAPKPWK